MKRNNKQRKQDDLIVKIGRVVGVLAILFIMWILVSIVDVNIHNANLNMHNANLNTNTYSILNFFEFWGRIF